MAKIEWEWGYYGRCFVDGKFSHGVRFTKNHDGTFDGTAWDECPNPTGRLLRVFNRSKSVSDLVGQAVLDAIRDEAVVACPFVDQEPSAQGEKEG